MRLAVLICILHSLPCYQSTGVMSSVLAHGAEMILRVGELPDARQLEDVGGLTMADVGCHDNSTCGMACLCDGSLDYSTWDGVSLFTTTMSGWSPPLFNITFHPFYFFEIDIRDVILFGRFTKALRIQRRVLQPLRLAICGDCVRIR